MENGYDADETEVTQEMIEAGARCLVGMEACATAHYWARELSALGHEVRLMPAQYVKGTSNNSTPGGETSNQIQGTHEI